MMTVFGAGLDDLLASPDFITDPNPVFRRLRKGSPVHWVDRWGCRLLTRAEDIEQTIRDTRRFSSAHRLTQVTERAPGWGSGRYAASTPRRVEDSRDRIVVEPLVRRLPGLRGDPDTDPRPDVRPDVTSRGLRTLHLAFDAPPP